MSYFKNKAEAVEYVNVLLHSFGTAWPLTMTITPEPSGAFSVQCVTETSLDATEQDLAVLSFLPTQVNT
jgi:hypothetical protein